MGPAREEAGDDKVSVGSRNKWGLGARARGAGKTSVPLHSFPKHGYFQLMIITTVATFRSPCQVFSFQNGLNELLPRKDLSEQLKMCAVMRCPQQMSLSGNQANGSRSAEAVAVTDAPTVGQAASTQNPPRARLLLKDETQGPQI